MRLSVLYLTLIAFFYEKSDGFNYTDTNPLRYSILKTLPILALALAVHFGWGNLKAPRRLLLVIALVAGACGDFLISMGRDMDMELNFALSSIFFGISHIFYMAGFAPHMKRISPPSALVATVYAFVMVYAFLLPNFYSNPITTLVLTAYSAILTVSVVISGSLVFEGTNLQAPAQKNNILRFAGYCLFFVSDSFLLLEQADLQFPCCKELLILSTYYAAQYLIMSGAVATEQLIGSENHESNFKLLD